MNSFEEYEKYRAQFPFYDPEEEIEMLGEARGILGTLAMALDDKAAFDCNEAEKLHSAVRVALRLLEEGRGRLCDEQERFWSFCQNQIATKKGSVTALQTDAALSMHNQ